MIRHVPRLPLPGGAGETVQARVAEGFSCYALYPEQYVDAAQQVAGMDDSSAFVCIGLRSIGAVLASIVAASLRRRGRCVVTRSVRPRGHPFDRRLAIGTGLRAFIADRSSSTFLIVDEGPGISGSSFAAAVDALTGAGVSGERIALLPAWRADPSALRSERAQRAFSDHRVVVGTSPVRQIAEDAVRGPVHELSAGAWRTLALGGNPAMWPAVHPQHERVKFTDSAVEPAAIARFAGLGRHGRAKLTRAAALHAAGFGPAPRGISAGLLVLDWVHGAPLRAREFQSQERLERIADYLAFTAEAFATDESDAGDDLVTMLRQNASEGLDAGAVRLVDRFLDGSWPTAGRRVAVDGRHHPHDWIDAGQQVMKVDALDHHADDFLPGCRDIAWDIAGACVELRLPDAARQFLIDGYSRRTGDRQIVERMPFFTAAYLAYRLGYATLAAESLGGTADGVRFTRLRERYRRLLAALVARPGRFAAR